MVSARRERNEGEGRSVGPVAADLGPVQDAAVLAVEGIAPMHGAAVVPQHHIAEAPSMAPDEAGLRRMGPKAVQQFLAFRHRKAGDVGVRPAAEEHHQRRGPWPGLIRL